MMLLSLMRMRRYGHMDRQCVISITIFFPFRLSSSFVHFFFLFCVSFPSTAKLAPNTIFPPGRLSIDERGWTQTQDIAFLDIPPFPPTLLPLETLVAGDTDQQGISRRCIFFFALFFSSLLAADVAVVKLHV